MRAQSSSAKPSKDRSRKDCVCGGHSTNARKPRRSWKGRARRLGARIKRAAAALALVGCTATSAPEPVEVVPDPSCGLDFCAYEGWCSDVGGVCLATTQAHCDQSQQCRDHGCCRLLDGHCVCY